MSTHSNPTHEFDRDAVVAAIVNGMDEFSGNIPGLIAKLKADFPGVTTDDIIDCFDEAAEQLNAQADQFAAEADDLEKLAPLFDGMPEGMELGECARIKAEQGDPLAIAFLKWEAEQAGGVQ